MVLISGFLQDNNTPATLKRIAFSIGKIMIIWAIEQEMVPGLWLLFSITGNFLLPHPSSGNKPPTLTPGVSM